MRRGQAEIVGLMLIVILLVIGLLLYIKFGLVPDTGFGTSFEQNEMAKSYVNALAKTEKSCGGVFFTIEEIISDLAEGTPRCGGNTARLITDFMNYETLKATGGLWGYNYRLTVRKDGETRAENLLAGMPAIVNTDYALLERCNSIESLHPMPRSSDRYLIASSLPQKPRLVLELCG